MDRFLYLLFLSGFRIDLNLFKLLRFDVVLQFLVYLLAKSLDYSAAVLFKALVDSRISRAKRYISLAKNVVGRKDAGNGQRSENNGRSIQLGELNTGLYINDSEILLGILSRVRFTRFSNSGFRCGMDLIDIVLGILHNLVYFGCGFASDNGAYNHPRDSGHYENLRAVLSDLHHGLIHSAADALYNFGLIFHSFHSPFRVF